MAMTLAQDCFAAAHQGCPAMGACGCLSGTVLDGGWRVGHDTPTCPLKCQCALILICPDKAPANL